MAKTKKGAAPDADDRMPTARTNGPAGGVQFSSADNVMEAGAQQVQLSHTTKPFTREAWERAKPWMLEQRQKLESQGWLPTDHARTELYVLRRTAPHGSYTEDGSIYVRVPKKFIDFVRSAKPKDEAEAKKAKSKRKEHAPSYNLDDPFVWKIKIDGAESEEEGRVPTVMMDVVEPMENIMYLVMTLSPGLVKLNASRKDAMLPGTHQAETGSLDPSAPSVRHTALFAASEQLTRTLPPAFWFKRNEEHLRKILGDDEYDATREAAEDDARSATRELGPVTEKIWEEMLPVVEAAPKKKKKRAASMAIATAPDVNATGIAAA